VITEEIVTDICASTAGSFRVLLKVVLNRARFRSDICDERYAGRKAKRVIDSGSQLDAESGNWNTTIDFE
jgi:hypothetical protein